jgi:uncharacterized protein (DUF433 family)
MSHGYFLVNSRRAPMFERISFDPKIMGGRACVRGMRITVSLVLSLLANGLTESEVLSEYPDLESEDIAACLNYAVFLASEEIYPLAATPA